MHHALVLRLERVGLVAGTVLASVNLRFEVWFPLFSSSPVDGRSGRG
ncbi:MAG: hypothetical protein JWO90_784 [Solirubrobacterales bacterium]|jgi:hypothetical protein|nr:hypothetical protein [Solirubrobacterales bacterium]